MVSLRPSVATRYERCAIRPSKSLFQPSKDRLNRNAPKFLTNHGESLCWQYTLPQIALSGAVARQQTVTVTQITQRM